MEHTMTNVRSLLKPGGKLVLFETTQDPTDLFFTFGLLPGWWLSKIYQSIFLLRTVINIVCR
jgi:hypothetical protein